MGSLYELVGGEAYERNYRVLWGESSRLLLESVCLRGDRRIGYVLETLHDAGTDPAKLSAEQLREALAAHGLDHRRYLRGLDPYEPVPWDVVNDVDRDQEGRLMAELDRRAAEAAGPGGLLVISRPRPEPRRCRRRVGSGPTGYRPRACGRHASGGPRPS
jgi:hypothetical protein